MQPASDAVTRYDLHCHSYYSDGALSPADLIQRACEQGVTHLALTDHDSVDGVSEAQAFIEQHRLPIELIVGTEITCSWEGFEIHLVALNFNADASSMKELLMQQQQCRRDRYQAMVAKLHKAGIDVQPPMAQAMTMPTRKHLADALVDGGWVCSFETAFRRYLGKGQQAYVATQWVTLADAVTAVAAAGGVTVIAHPHAYQLSNKWLRRLLTHAKDVGVTGVEVAIGTQSPGQREALATFAEEIGLAASVGSDFHYPARWRELGKNLCLPERCVPIWTLW
ncbi:PHP domain-containing protein [Pseudidiomarina tainanensis]|uniref:PHP domain-containing protein n=1 Tax=Pseudidiomarina tainanensis TaxID=502365 RepID=UPI001F38D5D3|nr:PHP domain-containing protein [Pseudidiomarina tainanensis]